MDLASRRHSASWAAINAKISRPWKGALKWHTGMPGTPSRSAITASDVSHEPSGSSPSNAGQLPLRFCTRGRNSCARFPASERNPSARAARHEGSRAACWDVVFVAHPPDGSCLRVNSSSKRLCSRLSGATWPLVIVKSDLVKRTACDTLIKRTAPGAATLVGDFVDRQPTCDWLRKSSNHEGTATAGRGFHRNCIQPVRDRPIQQ